MGDLIGRG